MALRLSRWTGVVLALAGMPALALDPSIRFHDYVKDAWSLDEGLPQITVMAISQDAEGFVWVGTQAGLARFDGVRFTSFNPDNTPALAGMLTQALLRDRAGTLWVGTYKGLARYRDREFSRIAFAGLADGVGFDVRAIAEGPDGTVYASGPDGVFFVEGEALHAVPGAPAEPGYALLATRGGLWVGTNGGVYRIADGRAVFQSFGSDGALSVTRLLESDGALLAGTSEGVFEWRDERWQRLHPDMLPATPIEALYRDGDGNLWVGTTGVLLRLRQGRVAERIADDSPSAHRAVRSIFEDREGNLWIGSQWEGLARLWNGWTRRHGIDEGLHDPIVWSVAPDGEDGAWVGSNDGLARYTPRGFEQVLRGDQLPHPNAYTLLVDGETLWIGTRRGVVAYRDGRVVAEPDFGPLANTQVNGLLRDRAGALWIASLQGLYRHADGELTHFGQSDGLRDPRVRFLHETRDGRLLAGTQDGLFEFRGGTLLRVGESEGLPAHNDITAIHELADGSLVVGTLSEQLYHFDGKRWFAYSAAHGLPGNSAFHIGSDSQGWLWVAGIRGVYRVRLQDLAAVRDGARATLATAQMLLSERGDQPGSQKGYCCNGAGNAKGFERDDRFWLPTRGGVVTVSSAWVHGNPVAPTVAIERVRHDRGVLPVQPGTGLALPPGVRSATIDFTALSFQKPNSLRIEYRLAGLDDAWRPLADSLRRDATYTNLAPGDYVFEVRAWNNAGVKNVRDATLALSVPPFFTETPAFHALLTLAGLALLWALHRLRTRALRDAHIALERQVDARTQELGEANARLEQMSYTDALTGLRNRRYLAAQLPADVAFYVRQVRTPGNEGSVMMLAIVDIDHFKSINDRYGHQAGDLVLQQFARLLEHLVRSGDYVVRWGGEEFLLVFRPMPWREASKVAERLRKCIADHPFRIADDHPLRVTASIGFVEYPLFRDGTTTPNLERMIEVADKALYFVKAHGRNGWATYRPTIPMRLEDLLLELERATLSGELPPDLELVTSR